MVDAAASAAVGARAVRGGARLLRSGRCERALHRLALGVDAVLGSVSASCRLCTRDVFKLVVPVSYLVSADPASENRVPGGDTGRTKLPNPRAPPVLSDAE